MVDAREQYIASQGPRKRRTHPARSAQALNTSGAGIVHRNMMDLQRQPNLSGSDIDRLKGLRRDWNRNRKYTDAGMALAGASTPQDAMKYYSDTTEDFRQLHKPAYGQMYPITAGIMNIGEKGGILGAILSEIGKMGKDGGLPTIVDDTEEEQIKYVTDTFGPHLEEIEELDFTDEYEGPWPHDERSLMSDEQAAWLREMNQNPYYQNLLDPNVVLPFEKERRGHPHRETYTPDAGPILGTASPHDPTEGIRVEPWLTDPSLPMPEIEEDLPPIIPFDDSNREEAIRRNMMPDQKSDKDHPLWDEYWNFLIDEGDSYDFVQGGPPSFEEYKDSRGRIYKGKPHALHSSYR